MEGKTTDNYTTIRIKHSRGDLLLTNIYDEPGTENKRLEELKKAHNIHGKDKILLAGDFNSKNEIWGGRTDARGEKLAEWIAAEGLQLENDRRQLPTFSSNNGNSYIDITISKNILVRNWTVDDEETLSDHRYITYTVDLEINENKMKVYDFANTDWNAVKLEIDKYEVLEIHNSAQLDNEAERYNEHCRALCNKLIARKVIDTEQNIWWDDEIEQQRRRVNRERREWQTDKMENAREENRGK